MAFEISTLLVERPSGIGIYGQGLIRALAHLRPDREHCQVYRLSRAKRKRFLPAPELPARGYWSGTRLHRRFGTIHALDTRIPEGFQGPLVATLFDVISALPIASERGFSSARFLRRKRGDYRRIARRADLVIALSGETRDRFLALEKPAAPVVVIPPGVGPEFLAAGAARPEPEGPERLGLPRRYLLLVGALCPRKNLEAALGAFLRARARARDLGLVVAGEPAPGWARSRAAGEILRAGGGVRLLGYLDRGALPGLYAGAAAFLYLSHYEGFGLPVLEALAAGAPVIASRRGGIPEAAGEAALLVDPDSPQEVDGALSRILSDGAFREELRGLGRSWAARFTWEAAARAVEAAYAEAHAFHSSVRRKKFPNREGKGYWKV